MYKTLTLCELLKNKENLIAFSNMNVYDIKILYKLPSDKDIDCNNFEYQYDLPLYAKMIKRFQNNSAVQLHNQITPGYQQMLQYKYHLSKDVLDFFAWIENSLGSYHIVEMGCDVAKWKQNSIQFFFDLDQYKQAFLINNYNEKVLEWNKILA